VAAVISSKIYQQPETARVALQSRGHIDAGEIPKENGAWHLRRQSGFQDAAGSQFSMKAPRLTEQPLHVYVAR